MHFSPVRTGFANSVKMFFFEIFGLSHPWVFDLLFFELFNKVKYSKSCFKNAEMAFVLVRHPGTGYSRLFMSFCCCGSTDVSNFVFLFKINIITRKKRKNGS